MSTAAYQWLEDRLERDLGAQDDPSGRTPAQAALYTCEAAPSLAFRRAVVHGDLARARTILQTSARAALDAPRLADVMHLVVRLGLLPDVLHAGLSREELTVRQQELWMNFIQSSLKAAVLGCAKRRAGTRLALAATLLAALLLAVLCHGVAAAPDDPNAANRPSAIAPPAFAAAALAAAAALRPFPRPAPRPASATGPAEPSTTTSKQTSLRDAVRATATANLGRVQRAPPPPPTR